jgi:hypothetical protein
MRRKICFRQVWSSRLASLVVAWMGQFLVEVRGKLPLEERTIWCSKSLLTQCALISLGSARAEFTQYAGTGVRNNYYVPYNKIL